MSFWHPSFLTMMNYNPHTDRPLGPAPTMSLAKLHTALRLRSSFISCTKCHKSSSSFYPTHMWLILRNTGEITPPPPPRSYLPHACTCVSVCACMGRTCVRAPVLQSLHLPWRIVPRGLMLTVPLLLPLAKGSRESVVDS